MRVCFCANVTSKTASVDVVYRLWRLAAYFNADLSFTVLCAATALKRRNNLMCAFNRTLHFCIGR